MHLGKGGGGILTPLHRGMDGWKDCKKFFLVDDIMDNYKGVYFKWKIIIILKYTYEQDYYLCLHMSETLTSGMKNSK